MQVAGFPNRYIIYKINFNLNLLCATVRTVMCNDELEVKLSDNS